MSVVVVDASTALAWCFPDESSAVSEGLLVALRGQALIVPAIWPLEIANVVLIAERRGRLKSHQVQRFLELLAGLNISEQAHSVGDAVRNVLPLAHKHNLRISLLLLLHRLPRNSSTSSSSASPSTPIRFSPRS